MESQYISRIQKIEAVLDKWLPENPGQEWAKIAFPGMEKIPCDEMLKTLTQPLRDLLSRGGKRWRPLLMTLVCETLGGKESALPLSPLIEFCHNASLIHDDIEDNSDERRGKAAVHILYGTDTAINSGCFLYFLPLCCIESWTKELHITQNLNSDSLIRKIYAVWAEHMRALHLGQSMDIAWHRDFSSLPSVNDYLAMCALKTGCLAKLSAVLGICSAAAVNIYAHKNENDLNKLFGAAAENLGVGFQIIDDVKNLRSGTPGKKRGDDIVEGKKSLPVLLYLHRYPQQADFVAECFSKARINGTGTEEAENLISRIETAGMLDEAEEQGRKLIAMAKDTFGTAGKSLTGENNEKDAQTLLAGLPDLLG